MSTRTLPPNPSLDRLRQQARALQRAVRAGDPAAIERVTEVHPAGAPADPAGWTMSAALLVVAREYGFPSWPRLKRFVELDAGRTAHASDPLGDVADEFCRQVCISYTAEDGPERWRQAEHLLATHPRLTRSHIWAAAAAAQPGAVGWLLQEEPTRARLPGGPYGWGPLFYLAYSRVAAPPEMVLATAQLLLEAGADPNEQHPHPGLPYPLTVLTGVFGEAEDGTERQPAHPCWERLTTLLRTFGADPSDPQLLRNRMFRPSNDHLRALFGLGYPAALARGHEPADEATRRAVELWRAQLRYAVEHDLTDRVRLLAMVDYWSAYPDGRTLLELARERGNDEMAQHFIDLDIQWQAPVTALAIDPALLDAERGVARLLSAAHMRDLVFLRWLAAERPDIVDMARRHQPNLISSIAFAGVFADTILLLVELGFDVNSTDGGVGFRGLPTPALNRAVMHNDLNLVKLLLSLGADPNLRAPMIGRTALDEAVNAGHDDLVALLTPITSITE